MSLENDLRWRMGKKFAISSNIPMVYVWIAFNTLWWPIVEPGEFASTVNALGICAVVNWFLCFLFAGAGSPKLYNAADLRDSVETGSWGFRSTVNRYSMGLMRFFTIERDDNRWASFLIRLSPMIPAIYQLMLAYHLYIEVSQREERLLPPAGPFLFISILGALVMASLIHFALFKQPDAEMLATWEELTDNGRLSPFEASRENGAAHKN